jgi:hypothetical protein
MNVRSLRQAGRQVAHLERVTRSEIAHGRLQRSMSLVASGAALVSGVEAYVQHGRGNFASRWMWTPVWLTPPAVVAGAVSAVNAEAARRALPAVAAVSIADGLVGFGLHLRGIRRLPGGFRSGQYNVVMGPPMFAPLLLCIVGVLGLFASASRREERPPRFARDMTAGAMLRGQRGVASGPLAGLARRIAEGRFQRGLALVAAGFAILAGGEAYVEHLRGSYNHRLMWTPVAVTPPMVVAAVAAARSAKAARSVLPLASSATFFDGLLGFALHLRGIRRMPGGFSNLRFNTTLGPPLFAPLLFTAVGVLGLVASLLRRADSGVHTDGAAASIARLDDRDAPTGDRRSRGAPTMAA